MRAAEKCYCAGCNFLRRQEWRVEVWKEGLERYEEMISKCKAEKGEEYGRELEHFAIEQCEELLRKQKQELDEIYTDQWLREQGYERYRDENDSWEIRNLRSKRENEESGVSEELVIGERLSESYEQERVRSDEEMEFSSGEMHVAEQFDEHNNFHFDACGVYHPEGGKSNSSESSNINNSNNSNCHNSSTSASDYSSSTSASDKNSSTSSKSHNSIFGQRDAPAGTPFHETVTGWATFPFDRGRWFNSGGSERRPRRYGKDIPFDRGKMEQRMDGDWSQRVQELEYSTTPMCCA